MARVFECEPSIILQTSDTLKKNIILLVVDALIPSRTGFGGNRPNLTPELNEFVEQSLYCSNVFSMGNPTEFSLPGLFASSYLLDDGGFANGITNRKTTLAKALQDHGYQTGAFLPIYRPFSDGYDRGFDDFFYLFDANVILKNFANTANWYQEKYRAHELSEKECLEELAITCDSYFADIVRYCQIWQRYIEDPVIPDSLIFDNIDYASFQLAIEQEWRTFDSHRDQYVMDFLQGTQFGFVTIVENIVKARVKKAPLSWVDIHLRALLLRNLLPVWRSATSYKAAKRCFALALYRVLQGQQYWIKYPSAGFILQTFTNWIDTLDRASPFYAYLHLVDVHESNHYSFDVVGRKNDKQLELVLLKRAIDDIKANKQYSGNMLYDCSIRYVDHVIARLREFLKMRGLLENTLIVITSDHGGDYPNIPNRDHIPHRVDCFYDELYHVPLIFSAHDIAPSMCTGLVSSIDIAPTILDMVDVAIPESFKGHPVRGTEPIRDYVTMESQGRGPCDLQRKPVRVCVRTETEKLVYEAEPLVRSNRERITELYDLTKDPSEYHNLVGSKEFVKQAKPLVRIARERIREIRSELFQSP